MKFFRLSLASFFALALATFALAADPAGTWKFSSTGPNGKSLEATLVLKWDGKQLSGTIDNRLGKVAITQAQWVDDKISFTVVRELGRGAKQQKFTVHYAGQLANNVIQGTVATTGREGNPISIPWKAERLK